MKTHSELFAVPVLWLAFVALGAEKTPPPPQPPVKVRIPAAEFNYGTERFLLRGVAVVRDPHNGETLYLGGHNGGAPFGWIGHWALKDDDKTWRELRFSSAVLDPLREKAEGARKSAKLAEAAGRNIYYAAMEAREEEEAVRGTPKKLADEALGMVVELKRQLAAAKAEGWEREAVERARPLVERAEENLKAAASGFDQGRLEAALIKNCFVAQWSLDEAAACLASFPGPREGASSAYNPESNCIVLFGGSHHDHMNNETWIYDCTKKSWRQVWPETAPSPRMNAALVWSDEKKQLVLSGGATVLNKMVYQQGSMPAPAGEWTFDTKKFKWVGEGGMPGGSRIYRTIVPAYNPCWYDAAPRGDPKATADWLAKLEPNTWTAVPKQPAPAPERDWGTAVFDPDRDQIYRWTGGHCADPSTIVSTYHPAINRWSIPYVAEIYGKGMSFNGRPDCLNHTYLHYAYDPTAKRLICTSMGGTGVYNPDIRDFEFSVDQPFNRHIYETCTVGTPRGVFLWGQYGQTWLFDYAAREWKKFETSGERPRPVTDGSALCYDAKRDVLWMATFLGYQKPSGNIWRCDLKTGQIKAMHPANAETIGKAPGFNRETRESVYIPTVDLVLFNNFVNGKEVAYDPESNRWVLLNIDQRLKKLGTVSDTLTWDPKRQLVWNLNSYQDIYVLRIDPATLTKTDQ